MHIDEEGHGLAEHVVSHGEVRPEPQDSLDDELRVAHVATPVVALALHDADGPRDELSVPIARPREAAPVDEPCLLVLRQ